MQRPRHVVELELASCMQSVAEQDAEVARMYAQYVALGRPESFMQDHVRPICASYTLVRRGHLNDKKMLEEELASECGKQLQTRVQEVVSHVED